MFSTAKGVLRALQVPEIEGNAVDGAAELSWRKVGVYLGSYDAAVSQQLPNLLERYAVLYEPSGEGMAETLEV